MSKRTHLGLRLIGLVVLIGVAIWPKDHAAHRANTHDRAALHVATKAQAPNRLMIDDGLRARMIRASDALHDLTEVVSAASGGASQVPTSAADIATSDLTN